MASAVASHNGGLTGVETPFSLDEPDWANQRPNTQSIEERSFNAALIVLELHFEREATYMAKSMVEVKKMIARTLDASLNKADIRERLAKNVDIWMHMHHIFASAIPTLENRSFRQDNNGSTGEVAESVELMLTNYEVLKEDLLFLNNLLVISRNMLAIKETAQEICRAVEFDQRVKDLIVLCVNVTRQGYDGEVVDEGRRLKLGEIVELYKKVLVTCLQHTHNWTMGNDRFKMWFWFDMLFDEDMKNDPVHEMPPDNLDVEKVHQEVKNWLDRHSRKERNAFILLDRYDVEVEEAPQLTAGELPEQDGEELEVSTSPVWKADLEDKREQDRLYGRVSHEIDIWWKKVRDANFDGWVVQMESWEGAQQRAEAAKANAMNRYIPSRVDRPENSEQDEQPENHNLSHIGSDEIDNRSTQGDTGEDEDEEEEDDDDSYVEGPLRGLLTEIPNILDTKQIEALHMTVKACIVDSMGSGLTPAGENLQKTRCKMFLALDCGKNLLRELLVFIAVWEQTEQQFIFQITAQIIESFHHNALLPYAWNSLRILKDIVSPAQTVLLRLINYMFRARKDSPIYDDIKDYNRDAKLIHFLYNYFRCRVVPDCLALIHAQSQIRQVKKQPHEFPVDLWDMERAKDGLSQYLDFLSVIAEIPEMKALLIEWTAVYELITLLKALEAGVARKSIDERPMPAPGRGGQPGASPQQPQPNLPPLHDTPHKFPWAGIKIQILIILTSLIAPTGARRTGPGNPIVQKQILEHEGIMPLLNCCVYDGHNEYLKERATLAIKFLMEGCKEAQDFVKELVPLKQAQQQQAQAQARLHAEKQGQMLQNARAGVGATTASSSTAGIGVSGNAIAGANASKGVGEKDPATGIRKGFLLDGGLDVEAKIRELERNVRLAQLESRGGAEKDNVNGGASGSSEKKGKK